ncbi:MAG TPA: carbonic anhydrase [Tepidisphaeraceae bacterium]|jgi:carbonic anhydrase
MSLIAEILEYNREFVAERKYEEYQTDRWPNKKLAILTCMDTRLVELLPRAMNLRAGDVKIIKSAGAIVSHPFGAIMRSVLVAVYSLGVQEIAVIGHHDCGMAGLSCESILEKATERGIRPEVIETLQSAGINLQKWLKGFDHVRDGVAGSVDLIRKHPLLPKGVPVHGLLIDPGTGRLETVEDGYAAVREG